MVFGACSVIFLKPGGEEMVGLRVMDLMPPDEFLATMTRLRNGQGPADTQ